MNDLSLITWVGIPLICIWLAVIASHLRDISVTLRERLK